MGYQMPVFGLDQLQTNTAMQAQVPNIDFAGIVNDGLATYDNLTNRRKQGILSRLIAQNIDPKTGQVDYQAAMQQSRTMPFANENVGKFGQAMADVIAGQRKAQQDAMVLQSKLQKEAADTQKSYADAAKTGGEAATNKLGNINNMFRQAMAIGKPNLAGSILKQGVISGAISQEDADGILSTFNTLPTEQQQSFIQGAALGGVDPKFQFGTVDNQLDNETSRFNNTQNNQINQAELRLKEQQLQQQADQFNRKMTFEQQQQYWQQNKPQQIITGADGKQYAIYADGSADEVVSKGGAPILGKASVPNPFQQAAAEERKRIGRVDTVLNEIEKILPKATGSRIGAGVDWAAANIGMAPDGAVATGQLKTLSGQLIALMPKMSGPQSDKDVQMYREMAGMLDDPTVPIAIRAAALQTIRDLNNKYAAEAQAAAPQQPQTPPKTIAKPLSGAQQAITSSMAERFGLKLQP